MSTPSQSPLLRIPAKTTEDVDLAGAVGSLILNSYGQDPKEFSEQLTTLNRARQDAVRGTAGSDTTARDLLYKWFHMLEMLELRFPELRAPFPWKDALTNKQITQQSLAYEKASVIYNLASILSSLGSRTNRIGTSSIVAAASTSSPVPTSPISPTPPNGSSSAPNAAAATGTKLAYTSLRQSAGMLSYINENFLHAPSTDMSKDVVRWFIDLELAQATEVFWERTFEEKKGGNLVTRIASQAATTYTSLAEESKEWISKGIFERSWGLLVQAKAKHFSSLMQYHRALVDDTAGSHGSCLVRLTLAETLAKEAQKLSAQFAAAAGASSSSNSLPSDAGSSLKMIVDGHLAIVSARKAQAVKDNDLIYHDILPTESTLPIIEPMAVAQPMSIQDIYSSPEVQKVTGANASGQAANDLFSSLVPLGVHEAASMYSEEKAKLVRQEGERVSDADSQLEAVLNSLTLPRGLKKFKPDGLQDLLDPGSEVYGWAEEEIQGGGSRGEDGLGIGSGAIDDALGKVYRSREQARRDLDEAARILDEEAAQCEKLRVRHGDRWSQAPSGLESKSLRTDLKNNREALRQATGNDEAIEQLWRQSEPTIRILLGGREALDTAFAEALSGQSANSGAELVDLLEDDTSSDAQKDELRSKVARIESNLSHLHRLKKDRNDALIELRSKIQSDDISHILILNRRAPPEAQNQLFQQELEKFRPLTQRISRSQSEQDRIVGEIENAWESLNNAPEGRGRAQEWNKKNTIRERLVGNLRNAKDANAQVRAGLAKGVLFYAQLEEIAAELRKSSKSFVEERGIERDRLIRELDVGKSSTSTYDSGSSLEGAFGRMGVSDRPASSRENSLGPAPIPPPQQPIYHGGIASPPRQTSMSYASPPPPQRPVQASSPYDSLDTAFGSGSAYRSSTGPAPAPLPSQYSAPSQYGAAAQPPAPSQYAYGQQQYHQTPQQGHLSQYASANPAPSAGLPPPPPQWQSSSTLPNIQHRGGPPPPPLPGQHQHYSQAAPFPPSQQQQQQQHHYGQYNTQNTAGQGFPPPPQHYQQQFRGSSAGPPPPPLPGQSPQAGYNQSSFQSGPPPPNSYGQLPQQQRWQPPY